MARVAASPNILLIGRSLVTEPREGYIREGGREGGTYVKRGGTATPLEQFGCVFRRSTVICLPAATMRVLFLSLFHPLLPPPFARPFLSLSRFFVLCVSVRPWIPSLPLPPCLFPSHANFLPLPPGLTRGALPTCQRYIFCRPTNRLAGNFEIGTLI